MKYVNTNQDIGTMQYPDLGAPEALIRLRT